MRRAGMAEDATSLPAIDQFLAAPAQTAAVHSNKIGRVRRLNGFEPVNVG